MRRKSAPSASNSTHTTQRRSKFDADHSIRALENRLAGLEKAFENSLGPIDQAAAEIPTEGRKRPGPKPIHLQALLHDRDELVQM